MADQDVVSPRRRGFSLASSTTGDNPPSYHAPHIRGNPSRDVMTGFPVYRSRTLPSPAGPAGPILLSLAETLLLSESLSTGASLLETLVLSEDLSLTSFYAPSVAETLTLTEGLIAGSVFTQSLAESLTLSEGAVGFDQGGLFGRARRQHGFRSFDPPDYGSPFVPRHASSPTSRQGLEFSGKAARNRDLTAHYASFLVYVDELLYLGDNLRADYLAQFNVVETLSLAEAVGTKADFQNFLDITHVFLEDVGPSVQVTIPLAEEVDLNEGFFAASSQVTAVTGTKLIVTFAQLMRSQGLKDTSRYVIAPNDGGVPVGVVSVTPLRNTIQSGETISFPDPQPFTNLVDVGNANVRVGTLFFLRGRWQDVEATVVSTQGATLVLDRAVTTGDPGPLTWELSEAYYGAELIVTGTTRGKSYQLTAGPFLPSLINTPYQQSSAFVGLGDGSFVVSVEVLPLDLTLRVSLTIPISLDLLTPSLYVITGPTPAEVVGVRMENPTTLVLTTKGLAAGNYTLTLPLLKDQAQNIALL